MPESERITARERSELAALIRRREKVAKTATAETKAHRLAELEVQLASSFQAEDERFRDITTFVSAAVKRANAEINRRCEELHIPERFRPRVEAVFLGRGENALAERRAELRRVGQTQADADEKTARTVIERRSVEIQTELVRDGLTTEAGQRFLDSLPQPVDLMPALEVPSLLAALPGHQRDWAKNTGYIYDAEGKQRDRLALDELMGIAPAADADRGVVADADMEDDA